MTISVVNTASASTSSSTTHNITYPTGIIAGDVAVVILGFSGSFGVNIPAGWSQVSSYTSSPRNAIYTATMDGTESGTVVNFGTTTSLYVSIAMVVLRGVQAPQNATGAAGTTSNYIIPSITPATGDYYELAMLDTAASLTSTYALGSGWSNLIQQTGGSSNSVAILGKQVTGGAGVATTAETLSRTGGAGTTYTTALAMVPADVSMTYDATTPTSSLQSQDVTIDIIANDVYLDVSTLTVSTLANDATVGLGTIVDVSTATASLAGIDATAVGYKNLYPSRDQSFDREISYQLSNATTLAVNAGYWAKIDFELPTDLASGGLDSAMLRLVATGVATGGNIRIRRLTSEWSTNVNDRDTLAASTEYVTANITGAGTFNIDVSSLVTTASTFYGFVIDGQGFDGSFYSVDHATQANRPRLDLDYHDVPATNYTFDADTPNMTALANDSDFSGGMTIVMPTATMSADIITATPSASVGIDLGTVTLSAQASDATFTEFRTAVLYPTSDVHRVQGGRDWVNNTDYLEINYSATANTNSLFVPVGTTSQKAAVNKALERFDFPTEDLVSAFNSHFGHAYVNVTWASLPPGESGGTLLGEWDGTNIILDNSLESDPEQLGMVLVHEIGHVVDEVYITNSMRVNIWNALQSGTSNDVAAGTLIDTNAEVINGWGWLGYGDYFHQVGEAYANAFVVAYSDFSVDPFQYDILITGAKGDVVRAAITPDMPLMRGPFPVRTPAARLYFADLPAAMVTGDIVSATLRLNTETNVGGGNYGIQTISNGTYLATTSSVVSTSLPTGVTNVNITSIFDPTTFSSIHIGNVKSGIGQLARISSMDDGVTTTEPRLTVVYEVAQGATLVDVDSPSVSTLTANDVTLETVVSPDVTVDVETATIALPVPVASGEIPISVTTDSVVASTLTAFDPTVDINVNSVNDVQSPKITITRVPLTDVNGEPIIISEDDDPYFVATMRTLQGSRRQGISGGTQDMAQATSLSPGISYWFRFNEAAGSNIILDRAYDLRPDGVTKDAQAYLNNNGVVFGRLDGPEGRHSAYFNGDSFLVQNEPNGEIYYPPTSLEFTFRTTKSTQFIMGGADAPDALSLANRPPWELWMVDGYLEVRGGDSNEVIRGTTRLDDNMWHHVEIQQPYDSTLNAANPSTFFTMEIVVDSVLNVRRRRSAMMQGFPDYIGGRPESFSFGAAVPTSMWFVGDMTEVILRNGRRLTLDEVAIQSDAMFGIIPVRPEAARMTLTAADAVVKGNKPTLLVLDFGVRPRERVTKIPFTGQAKAILDMMPYAELGKVLVYPSTVDFDFPGWGEGAGDGLVYGPPNSDEVIVRRISVWQKPNGSTYRDPITDNHRLIDLTKDINMDDMDIISIIGYPRNAEMWSLYDQLDSENIAPKTPMRQQLENLMVQIRQQVTQHRKNLYITDPFSAIALGIINRVEYVPNMIESGTFDSRLGATGGIFDWHSYITDPFNSPSPGVPLALQPDKTKATKSNRNAAGRYIDTHANIRQRVRATIDGLTTIPSWVPDDIIVWENVNPMGNPPSEMSRRYVQKPFGLQIGDEFIMDGGYRDGLQASNLQNRVTGWVATPIRNILVGTAVTSFCVYTRATTILVGDNDPDINVPTPEVDDALGNPYYDHAVSIAVQPGDTWSGEVVSGKVYINFTESYTYAPVQQSYSEIMHLASRGWNDGLYVGQEIKFTDGTGFTITAEMLRYQWSTYYGIHNGSQVNLPDTGGSGPDWGWSPGGVRGGSGGGLGAGEAMAWFWKPFVKTESIYTPSMSNRAFKWLTSDLDVSGNASVSVGTASASIQSVDQTVEVSSNVDITVPTVRATIEGHNDLDTIDPDIEVLVGTADIEIRAAQPVEEVVVDTAVLTLNAVELQPGEFTVDWTEAVVLTMPRQIVTLILEDN